MGVTKRITETVMYLPEDDADAFDSLIIYIYQNLLPAFPTEKHPATKEGSAKYYEEIIYPLLVLAEKLCLNNLANRLMDLVQDIGMENYTYTSVRTSYCMTPAGSKLQLYSVLMELYQLNSANPENFTETWEAEQVQICAKMACIYPEFAIDFVRLSWVHRARFKKSPVPDAQVRDGVKAFGRCFFHTHHENGVCHLGPEKAASNDP
ncbi:uncharacterized protein RSE6_02859 [Rhynchosporium secalis]|uniref:BTB domain-containing protein n=1 Tax=Rhynchosporium secalis TaxID=38038 RepID=A0A1E1M1C0_RHYSE|nr:uncharacterized protein RSE6_02859 [Rhynchosporium secalis]